MNVRLGSLLFGILVSVCMTSSPCTAESSTTPAAGQKNSPVVTEQAGPESPVDKRESAPNQTNTAATNPQSTLRPPTPLIGGSTLGQRTISGVTFGVLFLLLMFGGWKKLVDKQSKVATENKIEIISKRAVSQKTALLIAAVDGRRFLIAQGAEQLTLLSELDEPNQLYKNYLQQAEEEVQLEVTNSLSQSNIVANK